MPISQHGVPRCLPPPRAPECPFSGLSLTMPMSCPTLALGLAFRSSVTPPYPQSWVQTQEYPKSLPSPTSKGSDLCVPTFRKTAPAWPPLGQSGMAGEGPLGAPPAPALTHCAWSASCAPGSLPLGPWL